jgi:hypothetical protein
MSTADDSQANGAVLCHALLWRGPVPASARPPASIARGNQRFSLWRAALTQAPETEGLLYAYYQPEGAPDARVSEAARQAIEAELRLALGAAPGTGDGLSRLTRVFDAPGASRGQAPLHHYVVETDPEEGWFDEISRWYDQEHMPGLAAVPGCILARRYLNHDGGPRSLACYDLVARETLGSAPWLAVRHTAWSDRARPHFTHTRRTMFTVLA